MTGASHIEYLLGDLDQPPIKLAALLVGIGTLEQGYFVTQFLGTPGSVGKFKIKHWQVLADTLHDPGEHTDTIPQQPRVCRTGDISLYHCCVGA